MRRLLALLLLAGCAPRAREGVRVDLAAVLAEEPAPEAFTATTPAPPPADPGASLDVPARPGVRLAAPGKDTAAVRRLLERQREETRRGLAKRLREFYAREADRFALERLRGLDAVAARELAAADSRIRAEFLRYAETRGPLVMRLAVLAGFPDPNPTSREPEIPLGKVSRARFDEAKATRERIAALDAAFRAFAQNQVDGVAGLSAEERAKIAVAVEEFRTELDRRAEREARDRVAAADRDLRVRLAEAETLVLPPQPGRSVNLAPGAPPPPAPRVPSETVFADAGHRRALLQGELRTWLGLRRYRLDPAGRDATSEFKAWRATFPAGPSPTSPNGSARPSKAPPTGG